MTAQSSYDQLADGFLSRPGVSLGRSMNNETLTVGGKIFAFLKGDRLVVKLPAAVVAAMVSSGDAVAFTAGGRTMREWAMVADTAQWAALMEQACTFVSPSS